MSFKEINVCDIDSNVFEMIGKQWMLVTAKKEDKVNTMTASWGGFGVMWGKNVAYIVIRPQRYTKEFIDSSDTLSLTFFGEEYRKMLSYMGTTSGRDEDKIKKSGLIVEYDGETPYFSEAEVVLKARKLYADEIKEGSFIDKSLTDKWYKNVEKEGYHILYICEIEKVLVKG